MELLDIKKPEGHSRSHYKALLYTRLYQAGFQVYIDLVSTALVRYTSGMKGYKQVKFDIVVFLDQTPTLIINFAPSNRRATKARWYGVPMVIVTKDMFTQRDSDIDNLYRKVIGQIEENVRWDKL